MSRHAVTSDKYAENRQSIWEYLIARKKATSREIQDATRTVQRTVDTYLVCLEAGGFVDKSEVDGVRIWTFIGTPGPHAPRLKRDGSPVTQGVGTLNMWRTMRMMVEFTAAEIMTGASNDLVQVREETAKSYCSMLLRAGYLRVVQKARPGKHPAIYRLIRNHGPQAPQVQRVKRIHDPNNGEVYELGGVHDNVSQ